MKCPNCGTGTVTEKWSDLLLSQYGENKVRPLCLSCLEFYVKILSIKKNHPAQARAWLTLLQSELV
jgi:hypothetical protein